MPTLRDAYDELYVYTMGRPGFILQHVVDAFMAQSAEPGSSGFKPIGLVFALVGLYLHVEKGFNGTQVQRVHMLLGKRKRDWPAIPTPARRGTLTPIDVLAVPAGAARDSAIDAWYATVWEAYHPTRQTILDLLREHEIT